MKFYIETERLILRDFLPEDAEGLFELDSNPDVHRYLGNNPVTHIEESRKIIENVRQQYSDHGIGRWITIEKSTGSFIGWSGLKFITGVENDRTHFHDIGYRFIPKFWEKGYATESAGVALEYGFTELNLEEIIGMCHEENLASRKVLEKCGLEFIEKFTHNDLTCDWLSITRKRWNTVRK